MLSFVVHRLGDSRKSAREVAASRLYCSIAGFLGVSRRLSFTRSWSRSLPVHKPAQTKLSVSVDVGVSTPHALHRGLSSILERSLLAAPPPHHPAAGYAKSFFRYR